MKIYSENVKKKEKIFHSDNMLPCINMSKKFEIGNEEGKLILFLFIQI